MLVIVHDWLFQSRDKLILDVETIRGSNVLQVYSCKSKGRFLDDVDEFFRIARIHQDWHRSQSNELVVEHRLAFHHWQRCECLMSPNPKTRVPLVKMPMVLPSIV